MRLEEIDWGEPGVRAKVGGRIKRAVAQTDGLTLKKLADEVLGCSPTIVYQYVSGVRTVRNDHLEQIAVRTNHTREWFFQDVESSERRGITGPADEELSIVRRDLYHWKEIVDALDLPFADPYAALTRRIAYLDRLVGIARIASEADPVFLKEYADVLLRLGRARTEQFHFREAIAPLEEAGTLFDEIAQGADPASSDHAAALRNRDSALQTLGAAYEGLGLSDRAIGCFVEVERRAVPFLRWYARLGLCAVHIRHLDVQGAARAWRSAMESLADPEAAAYFPTARPYLRGNLAGFADLAADYALAVHWRSVALREPPSQDRAEYLLDGLLQQTESLLRLGHHSEARIPVTTARLLAQAIRDARHESRAAGLLACLEADLGRGEEARECAVLATTIAAQSPDPVVRLRAVLASAEVHAAEGETAQALALAERAVAMAQETTFPPSRLVAYELKARLWIVRAREGGRPTSEACDAAEEFLRFATASGNRGALLAARLLQAEAIRLCGAPAADVMAVAAPAAEPDFDWGLLTGAPGWERLGLAMPEAVPRPSGVETPVVRLTRLALAARLTEELDVDGLRSIAADVLAHLNPEDAAQFRARGWQHWLRNVGLPEEAVIL